MKKIISIALAFIFIGCTSISDNLVIAQEPTVDNINPLIDLARIRTVGEVEVENISNQPLILNKQGYKYESFNNISLPIKGDVKIISKDITYNNAVVEGNLYISANNVKVNNTKVSGTIFIDPGKDGIAVLSNVSASSIRVISGGEKGIYLNKVTSDSLVVDSYYKVKVETADTTNIRNTSVYSDVILDSYTGSFGNIIILKKDKHKINLDLKGMFAKPVTIGTDAVVKISDVSKVEKIVISPVNEAASVSLKGEFNNVDITEEAVVELGNNTKICGQLKLLTGLKMKTDASSEVAFLDIAPESRSQSVVISGAGVFKEVKISKEAKLEIQDSVKIRDNLLNTTSSIIKSASTSGIAKLELVSNPNSRDFVQIEGTNIGFIDIKSSLDVSLKESLNMSVNIGAENVKLKASKDTKVLLDTNGHASLAVEAEYGSLITKQDLEAAEEAVSKRIAENRKSDKQVEEASIVTKNTFIQKIMKEKQAYQKKVNEETNLKAQPSTQAYIEFININDYNNKLIVVNKTRSLPENWIPNDLVPIKVPFKGRPEAKYMRKEAADALLELFAKAKKDGISIYAVSGFRSYQLQRVVYAKNIFQLGEARAKIESALPGRSEHQTGLAVDITCRSLGYALKSNFATTKEGKWLSQNAAAFGFIIRYPLGKENITGYTYEPWHIRYVGKEIAGEIMKRNITLEEYFELYQ